MKKTILFNLIFFFISCDNEPDSNITEWQKNKNIWDSYQMEKYSFDFRANCYCVDEWVREVNVSVNKEVITDIFFTDDSLKPTILTLNDWYSINNLFDIAKSSIGEAYKFEIEYDKKYGNPTMISIDWDSLTADDEIEFYTKNINQK